MDGFIFYYYIIIAALLAGLVRFYQLSPPFIKMLVWVLVLAVIAEIAPKLIEIRYQKSNHWWYNIITVLDFLLYSYLFSRAISNQRTANIIRWSIPAYLVLAFANMYFIQGFTHFHTISYRIGAVMIVVWCYLYFRQLLQSETEIVLLKNPMFWIATGLLFFYLGFFVYMNAFDLIAYKVISYNKQLWQAISYSLNTLLYSCFLIALLCQTRKVS